MASTRRLRLSSADARRSFFLLSLSTSAVHALKTMTPVGCFSSSQPLSDQGSYTYQTSGYCQGVCVKQNQAVLATSGGTDCWCGDQIPSQDAQVDDSNCNTPCNGYSQEMCGGDGFYSVYLSGTEANVPNYGGSSDPSSSAGTTAAATTQPTAAPASTPSDASSATTASPSVVTSVAPGQTVVITQSAAPQTGNTGSPSPTPEAKSSGGPNVAGIAAGVVVGVLAVAAIIGGAVFYMRRRKRQAAEDEYTRSTQVSEFMRGSDGRRPPATGYSSMSDSRLDPEAGARRNSHGSIADAGDYSRRILRVANPDGQ